VGTLRRRRCCGEALKAPARIASLRRSGRASWATISARTGVSKGTAQRAVHSLPKNLHEKAPGNALFVALLPQLPFAHNYLFFCSLARGAPVGEARRSLACIVGSGAGPEYTQGMASPEIVRLAGTTPKEKAEAANFAAFIES
jgi:hypothetical protein